MGENICKTHKGLVSVYKELHNSTDILIKTWAKDLNKHSTKKIYT